MTLEQYFHTIINQPRIVYVKETTMFERSVEKTKMFFNEQIEKINSLLTKPVAFQDTEPALEGDYWAFEMYTGEWEDEHGETMPVKHSIVLEPHDGTWMEVLDKVIDELEKHYGYPIKEQVYYSVVYPHNEECPWTGDELAGYGRSLNDNVLQQLLLAYPEVYQSFVPADYTITGAK